MYMNPVWDNERSAMGEGRHEYEYVDAETDMEMGISVIESETQLYSAASSGSFDEEYYGFGGDAIYDLSAETDGQQQPAYDMGTARGVTQPTYDTASTQTVGSIGCGGKMTEQNLLY